MTPHHAVTSLASGEQELTLAPVGGRSERLMYAGLCLALWAGGLLLLPAALGFAALGVGVVSAVVLYRTARRREVWRLKPGAATRELRGFGSSRETFVPVRVVALEEEDSDYRKVLRLLLEHQAGKVQIGSHTFDRDERALELARAFAQASGVPLAPP